MAITVLLVDDSRLARIGAARAVNAMQPEWRILEASNMEDALAAADPRSFDAALIDYNMPGANGLELARVLRTRFPDMPIAPVTANVQDQIVENIRELNGAFVPKPIEMETLRPFLEGAALQLRRRRAGN